jgi:hypothetical protein
MVLVVALARYNVTKYTLAHHVTHYQALGDNTLLAVVIETTLSFFGFWVVELTPCLDATTGEVEVVYTNDRYR